MNSAIVNCAVINAQLHTWTAASVNPLTPTVAMWVQL